MLYLLNAVRKVFSEDELQYLSRFSLLDRLEVSFRRIHLSELIATAHLKQEVTYKWRGRREEGERDRERRERGRERRGEGERGSRVIS